MTTTEFFIKANSFAAPFVSDTSEAYVTAESPKAALEKFASEYALWALADDQADGEEGPDIAGKIRDTINDALATEPESEEPVATVDGIEILDPEQ